jgi:cytochrome d ubiquinol oxidase subunit I
VYGWGRLSPRWHFASGVPIVLTGATGSSMVITVNARMNQPSGFRLQTGQVVDIDPDDRSGAGDAPYLTSRTYS